MNILITGATGLVATELTIYLLHHSDYRLILVSRTTDKLKKRYQNFKERIVYLTLEELISNSQHIDICVHTAFARSSIGADYAQSLVYLCHLANWAKGQHIRKFINISSQSVYGSNYTPLVTESGKCNPDYLYAMGKYSSELLCNEIFEGTNIELYNIRLASVVENARFMKVFVENALTGTPINLISPRQIVSFIDVRDVATALVAVLNYKSFPGIYNLGTSQNYTIEQVAQTVKDVAEKNYAISEVNITVNDNGTDKKIGMDATKFMTTFNWVPEYSLKEMVISLFEMLTNANGGGCPIAFKLVYGIGNTI